MNVLSLTRYDEAGASSRYRVYQYLPHLRAAGLQVDNAPLLDRSYVANLYSGTAKDKLGLVRAAVRRLWLLRRARRYDLVWFDKELLPYVPDLVEQLLRFGGVPFVVDYDDAIFHRYDQSKNPIVRAVLGRKIDRVMAAATLVIAGNPYLAERARRAGAKAVEILPTVVDLDRYPAWRPPEHRPLTLGWIGSPSTQRYLHQIAPALGTYCAEQGARMLAIGVRPGFSIPGVPLERIPWTDEGEVRSLQELDIGLMPLPDEPFERGKCGFKLIQYMGCALPTIGSPVGVNRDIIVDGQTGFLASSQDQWLTALRTMGASAALRRT